MGMESLDIVLNCRCDVSPSRLDALGLTAEGRRQGEGEQHCRRFTRELVHRDHIVQLEIMQSDGDACRVSIRTAVCCDENVASAMVALAHDVSKHLHAATRWNVDATGADIDLADAEAKTLDVSACDAEAVLRHYLLAKRHRLYETVSAADVPCAAKRPGNDCLSHVLRFSPNTAKERPA